MIPSEKALSSAEVKVGGAHCLGEDSSRCLSKAEETPVQRGTEVSVQTQKFRVQ